MYDNNPINVVLTYFSGRSIIPIDYFMRGLIDFLQKQAKDQTRASALYEAVVGLRSKLDNPYQVNFTSANDANNFVKPLFSIIKAASD
jgi:hypothetical protein